MTHVIVVGGGLAGLSAAHTVLERGGNVVLIDKNPFFGGNSTKATSGINGALTNTQIKLGIPDSAEQFYNDTAKSARDLLRPELAHMLTYNSGSAVEWLQSRFALDLSLVSRLGGHSQPRTHRGKEKFPGMTITYALMEKLEELSVSLPSRIKLVKKARVQKLLQNGNVVYGVEYVDKDGAVKQEYGPVILATGGYGSDFYGEDSLLKKYQPTYMNLPTTNGDHCTGDGLKMAMAIGGNGIDMEKVQVHPTGLVDPKDPNAKVKFLAAEALRGCGGILLNADGKRFCDELGHRDYVTGEMWKNKGPFRLVLNSKASKEIEWHCKHYVGRGLMKKMSSGVELAKEFNISPSVLESTFAAYNDIAKSKKDPFGKKFFPNGNFTMNEEYHVSIVTPVVHFTMGGIEINNRCEIIGGKNVISGLFAAGECAGGVHGANRLGGSALLGCVVLGRVSGEYASKYLLESLLKDPAASRIHAIGQHLGPMLSVVHNGIKVDCTFQNGLQFHVSAGEPLPMPAANSVSQVQAPNKIESKKELKQYTLSDVAKHDKPNDCWVVVNGQVLDVTNFLAEHPGGKNAILLFAGKDASEEFNMLHKKDVVQKYAPDSIIGTLK